MKTITTKKNSSGLYIFGNLYPYLTGGMEIFNYYFLKHQLKNVNNKVYYLSHDMIEESEQNFVPLKKVWPVRLFYPFQFFFAVKKLKSELDYAYISFAEQSWIISFSQSLILRHFKIPYIITIHWGKEPAWKFKYPFEYFFTNAHSVIGVSDPVCKAYKKVLGEKDVLFIPPLIPFEAFSKTKSEAKKKLGYNNEENIILFVGTLKPMKNPHIILQAVQLIEPTFLTANKIRLLFAGTGEMLDHLKTTTKKLQLTEFVRFDGLISRENIPSYYKAADCYIISSDYEGTSVSLLEAMFNRLPIIASDSPGINSMLRNNHNALLYKTNDTHKLAQNIKHIFSDTILAESLAENAYLDYEKNYSYEVMMKQYSAIFSGVIS